MTTSSKTEHRTKMTGDPPRLPTARKGERKVIEKPIATDEPSKKLEAEPEEKIPFEADPESPYYDPHIAKEYKEKQDRKQSEARAAKDAVKERQRMAEAVEEQGHYVLGTWPHMEANPEVMPASWQRAFKHAKQVKEKADAEAEEKQLRFMQRFQTNPISQSDPACIRQRQTLQLNLKDVPLGYKQKRVGSFILSERQARVLAAVKEAAIETEEKLEDRGNLRPITSTESAICWLLEQIALPEPSDGGVGIASEPAEYSIQPFAFEHGGSRATGSA
ncbi:MAG: hypothetical protein AAF394_13285 [Planctomycetota bacterium]